MKIQKPILELQKLGQMPDEDGTSNSAELLGKYDLLHKECREVLTFCETVMKILSNIPLAPSLPPIR